MTMPPTLYPRLKLRASPWRVGLCLLLATLFLYNPFFTIYGASRILDVQHYLSYRATVAGSELRRCTVEPAYSLIPALQAAVAFALLQPEVNEAVLPALSDNDLSGIIPQANCGSLWFRPPPVL